MTPYFQNNLVTIYHGDSREIMPTLSGVSAVVTDPPYHLTQVSRGGSCRNNDPETPFGRHKIGEKGFMGKTWDGGGISFDPEFWRLAINCALPGAYLISFGGSRTHHRIWCAIEDGGWSITDTIMYIFGSGFPKSLSISKAIDKDAGAEREVIGSGKYASRRPNADHSKQGAVFADDSYVRPAGDDVTAPSTDAAKLWSGYGSSLKPAMEPICLARKPLDGTYAQNALKHGCGGLAIDACRVQSECHDSGREGESSADRRYTENGSTNFSATPGPRGGDSKGRWPANIIHDGSPEVLKGFPETNSVRKFSKSGVRAQRDNPVYGKPNTTRNAPDNFGDSGSAARFFYCAKASGDEREDNTHATVKPLALMEYLCRLIKQPERNLVLDPFAGSGTTLLACELLWIPCIGIEMDESHCEIIAKRFSKPAEPYLL